MNYKFLLIMVISLIAFILIKDKQNDPSSSEEQHTLALLAKTAKIIKDKYNLFPCGSGAAMPGGPIREMTLCFDTKSERSQTQLRELIIKSSKELLHQVNNDKDIYSFLAEKPFTIKNVEIIIFNNDKNGLEIFDPQISVARISKGNLIYRTTDENDTFNYKNEYEETYEEALKILSNTHE